MRTNTLNFLSRAFLLVLLTAASLFVLPVTNVFSPHEGILGIWSDDAGSNELIDPNLDPGSSFVLKVNWTWVGGITTYDLTITYNFNLLDATSVTFVELNNDMWPTFCPGGFSYYLAQEVDVIPGTIHYGFSGGGAGCVYPAATPVVLLSMTFQVKADGQSSVIINLQQSEVIDPIGGQNAHYLAEHGFVQTTPTVGLPPVPIINYTVVNPLPGQTNPLGGQTITFNGTKSYDPDAQPSAPNKGIQRFVWTIQENQKEGAAVNHTFTSGGGVSGTPVTGDFAVSLEVTDADGNSRTNQTIVTILDAPKHDVSVTVQPTTGSVTIGNPIEVTIRVNNVGNLDEDTITLTVFQDSKTVREFSTFGLRALEGTQFEISLDSNVLGLGTYNIIGRVSIPDDDVPSNNVHTAQVRVGPVLGSSGLFIVGGLGAFMAVIAAVSVLRGRRRRED